MARRKSSPPNTPNRQEAATKRPNVFVLAASVSDRVSIETVLIASCSATRTPDADPDAPGVVLKVEVEEIGISIHKEDNVLTFTPKFCLRLVRDEAPDDNPHLKIECEFVAQYSCSNFEGIEEENLKAFAGTNVVFNTWPYWRHFAQDMSSRMGLKPIMIPLFRFPHKSPGSDK
jgi:hypothetical protein